jgi:hypothetical protein
MPYQFGIARIDSTGLLLSPFATVSVTVQPPAPITPAFYYYPATSQLEVSWNDQSGDETGFELQWWSSQDSNMTTFLLPADTTEFFIPGATTGTRYYSQVRAINSAGGSWWLTPTPYQPQ